MEIHELNTRESLSGADFFAVDNGTDTAKTSYSALSAAVLGDITGAASTILNNNLTASRVAVTNGSGKIGVSGITTTVLNRLSGLTENVQTALDSKAPLASPTFTGVPLAPTAPTGTNTPQISTTAFVAAAVANINPKQRSEYAVRSATVQDGRVTVDSGGYKQIGNIVFVNMALRLSAPLGGNDFFGLMNNFPKPVTYQALNCARYAKKGVVNAIMIIDGLAGTLQVATADAFAVGDQISISGIYYTA